MDDDRNWEGRLVGRQIDAWDDAVRRARIRHVVVEAVAVTGGLGLLGGLVGLLLGGVDVMVKMAVAGLLAGIFIGAIVVIGQIYTNKDED